MKRITKKQARELVNEYIQKGEKLFIDMRSLGLDTVILSDLKVAYSKCKFAFIEAIYRSEVDYETIRQFLFNYYFAILDKNKQETNHEKDYLELHYDRYKYPYYFINIWAEPYGDYYYLHELNKTWFMGEDESDKNWFMGE